MENVSEALIMAGSVLLFVIALSIAIASFGQVRAVADSAMDYIDRETTYIQGDYYYEATGTTRQVGLETVIPTIMRVYNESYEIYFDFKDGTEDTPLYVKKTSSAGTNDTPIFYLNVHDRQDGIDRVSDNVLQGGVEGKRLFFKVLLYGISSLSTSERQQYIDWYSDDIDLTKLPSRSLYNRLMGKKITESSGMYTVKTGNDAMDEDIRVITYTVE